MTHPIYLRLVAADPLLNLNLLADLPKVGVKGLLLDIPFTDPVAVTPPLEAASDRTLDAGRSVKEALAFIKDVVALGTLDVIVGTVSNLVEARGADVYCQMVADTGAKTLYLADVPMGMRDQPDEPFEAAAQKAGLTLMPACAGTQNTEEIAFAQARADSTKAPLYVTLPATAAGVAALVETLTDNGLRLVDCPVLDEPYNGVAKALETLPHARLLQVEPLMILTDEKLTDDAKLARLESLLALAR